jgi:hypothetical protein
MALQSIDKTLSRIRAAYLACNSYEDEGSARFFIHRDGKPECISDNNFRTVIAKPSSFTFEFNDPLTKTTGRTDGSISELTYYGVCKSDREPSVSAAISRMYVHSKGAAAQIAILILEDQSPIIKKSLLDQPFIKMTIEIFQRTSCFCLTTENGNMLLCGTDDHLIRYAQLSFSSPADSYVIYEYKSIMANGGAAPAP